MNRFGERLDIAMRERAPLCVGIDPHPALLRAWGVTDDPDGLQAFVSAACEAIAPEVAAIKPQSALFERHGSRGIAVLEDAIDRCRRLGALVIMDAKRGDIGSTATAYADAFLRQSSSLFSDALTVSPYLGFGSLMPFVEAARESRCGLFVLARTSNPESIEVQHARTSDGRTVGQLMIDQVCQLNSEEVDSGARIGSFGVVVGATIEPGEVDLARLNGPVLMPGLGAQGASAADVRALAEGKVLALATSSRDILQAGPDADRLIGKVHQVARGLNQLPSPRT